MNQNLTSWAIQIAILATGIYVFLRFLRTTRGGGLVRGLFVALLFGVIGLLGLVRFFELEELNQITESIAPYLVVIVVILFQPEMRRAITRLGEQNRLARLLRTRRGGTLTEISQAATAMAARRHGALVAFERETPLDPYAQNAVHVDSEISRHLIEGIFHPGGALHDGAIVIQGGRVAAAACLFPLTENIEISKSTGTRHRAALGLTEETDAVTLVVSEETGAIALCERGHMERNISPPKLEERLREKLGLGKVDEDESKGGFSLAGLVSLVRGLFTHDVARKLTALLLATVIIYVAHQAIIVEKDFQLGILQSPRKGPAAISLQLPSDDYHVISPILNEKVSVVVSGTRGVIDRLVYGPSGVLTVGEEVEGAPIDFPLDEVQWSIGEGADTQTLDLDVRLKRGSLRLKIERYDRLTVNLLPEHLEIDESKLDPRFQPVHDEIRFSPPSIELEGPHAALALLQEGGGLSFRFEDAVLPADDRDVCRVRLTLSSELTENSLSIAGGERVEAIIPVAPGVRDLQLLDIEIPIVNMVPGSEIDPGQWSIPQASGKARFRVKTQGVFAVDSRSDAAAFTERRAALRDFVEKNLPVYVNVGELREDGGQTLPVHYHWPPDFDWREALGLELGTTLDERANILVELESAEEIRIDRKSGPQ